MNLNKKLSNVCAEPGSFNNRLAGCTEVLVSMFGFMFDNGKKALARSLCSFMFVMNCKKKNTFSCLIGHR